MARLEIRGDCWELFEDDNKIGDNYFSDGSRFVVFHKQKDQFFIEEAASLFFFKAINSSRLKSLYRVGTLMDITSDRVFFFIYSANAN